MHIIQFGFVFLSLSPLTFIIFVVIQTQLYFCLNMWSPVRKGLISATLCLKPRKSTTELGVFCVVFGIRLHQLHTQYKCKRSGQNTQYFHFHSLLRKPAPCSISPNNSRWHDRRVRGILHSELYAPQPLTIPLFPFYFVSHLDHLLISFKIGGICWHKSRHNVCKIPLRHIHTLSHSCLPLHHKLPFYMLVKAIVGGLRNGK